MRGRNGQDFSLQTGKRKIRKGKVDVDIAQQDPRQNKIGPCLGAAGADKFSDSNNSKMRKRMESGSICNRFTKKPGMQHLHARLFLSFF